MAAEAGALVRHVDEVETVVHSACGKSVRIFTRRDTDAANLHVTTINDATSHYHEHCTEYYYILEGSGTMTLGGETVAVRPGTAILIPPGVPHRVVPQMEESLAINGKIVQIGRAAQRVPMYLETFQVRRGQFFGAQGHSGHANFPSVIRLVTSARLDLSPIITARYSLDDAVDAIAMSRERRDGKIMVIPGQEVVS